MVSTATIRKTIDIRGTSSGLDETKQKLVALSTAQDGVGVSSEKTAKSQISLEQAMAKLAMASEQNARQFQQLMQMQRAAADAQIQSLNMVSQAANDNARSMSESGIEWAEWTNRAKRAGEVALLLSPKLRSVVMAQRELAASFAQKAILPALELTAIGIVKGTNLAGTGLIALAGAAEKANPAFLGLTSHVRTAGIALEAFNPTIASVAGSILGRLIPALTMALRIVTPILLIKDAIDLMAEAWTLGGKKLEEFRGIAERAAAVDLSTTYFQRITKAATDAKLPIDVLTKALQNLKAVSTDQLGGSALNNRLSEHLKAGNFAGNSGVTALAQANTTEDRFKAIIKLIDEANAKGERLAALDIAKTVFGDDIAGRLRQDSEYLHNLEASAERISATQLVSDADIGRALDLQRRYDAAVAILEQRWHPIQDLLTQLGIKMQAAWVGIVEAIANAVDGAAKLVMKIGEIPASFWAYLAKGASAVAPALGAMAGAPFGPVGAVAGYAVGKAFTADGDDAGPLDARAKAVNRLAAGLKNHNSVVAAGTVALGVYDNVIRDTSKSLDDHAQKQQQSANAYERAAASVEKHIARLEADRKAVGLGVGSLEELRTAALLNTAAMQAGIPMTQALADKIQDLAQDAGDAATALAFDKAWDRANFDKMTMGLSDLDKQIASTMKNIYGPEWQAHMDDALAKQLRMNDAMRQMHDAARDAFSSLASGLASGKLGIEELTGAFGGLATKLASGTLNRLFDALSSGDFSKIFGNQNLASGAGLMSVAGAGLNGYKSASPGMGAVSGALAGAQFGPAGAVVGGLVGAIGGFLGQSDKLAKAKKEWQEAGPAFQVFLKQMAGGAQGDLSKMFMEAYQQQLAFAEKAQHAHDLASVHESEKAFDEMRIRESAGFVSTFQATLKGLADGLGPDSPFLHAVNSVKSAMQAVQKIVDDADTSFKVLYGDVGGPSKNKGTSEQLAFIAQQVGDAKAAAAQYMLTLLDTAKPLSDVATKMLEIQGTAEALRGSLGTLGVSADLAASAVAERLNKAVADLAASFADGLQREINAANDKDYLNSLSDLVAKFQSNLADAASLGLGPDLVNKWFKVSAQKIVDDAGLAGDAIAGLVRQFPDLAGVVTSSLQDLQGLQAAYDDTTSLVNDRRQDLVTVYQTEAKALQDNIEKTRSWIAQLKQFQQSLNIGQYSPYSPEQQYLNAKSQAQQDFALAMGGDQDAMDRIQGDLSTYLDQSRSYNASSEQYFRDFKDAQDMLDKLQASGQKQISTSQQQLDALNRQVSGLIDIKDMIGVTNASVLTIPAAIAALQAALSAQKQAAGNLVSVSPQSNIDALYQAVLGRDADAAGKAYWQQQIAAGMSGTDLTRSFISGAYAKGGADAAAAAAYAKLHGYQNGGIVGMYANGGIVGNGLFGIDSTIARFASGGYIGLAGGEGIINAQATQRMGGAPAIAALNAGRYNNDNGWRDVVAAYRQETQQLRAVVEKLIAVVAASDQETRAVLEEGNSVMKNYGSDMRKVASK